MKNIKRFAVVVLIILAVGCSNSQNSSSMEARYVVEHQEDFGDMVAVLGVSSQAFAIGFANDPSVKDMMSDKRVWYVVHILVYETKGGQNKMVLLSDSKPPKIVHEILLDKDDGEPKSE